MSAQARDLACHLARQVSSNSDLSYLIGPGSRTWELMIEAIASITSKTTGAVDQRYRETLLSENALRPSILRASYEVRELPLWIDYNYANPDIRHVDFRVEVKRQADNILSKIEPSSEASQ